MKKQLEFFREQTLQTKIAIVVVSLLVISVLLFFVGNLITNTQQQNNKEDNSSVVIEPTKTPSPNSTDSPEGNSSIKPYGPDENIEFPYGEESLFSMISTAEKALVASCNIIEGQTVEQKTELLKPYFVEAAEVAEAYGLVDSAKLTQECRDITVMPNGNARPDNTIDLYIAYTMFYTKTSEKDNPSRNTYRKHGTVKYTMQLQSDSSWKVLTIG